MLSGFIFDLRSVPAVVRAYQPRAAGHLLRGGAADAVSGGQRLASSCSRTARSWRSPPSCCSILARAQHPQGAAHERDVCIASLILIRKELLAILKDPRSRVVLFVPVIVQIAAVRLRRHLRSERRALRAARSEPQRRLDATSWRRLDGTGVFERVAELQSMRTDRRRHRPQAGAARDPHRRRTSSGSLRRARTRRCRSSPTGAIPTPPASAARLCPRGRRALQRPHGASSTAAPGPPLRIETRAWYNPNLETRWNMIPSLIAALSMLQTLMLTALSVAREREQGTFDQLLVTPLRPTEIMIGKARAVDADRPRAVDAHSAAVAVLVRHSLQRLACHAVPRPCCCSRRPASASASRSRRSPRTCSRPCSTPSCC